ncbi:hypothetical protein RFI_23733 [Reticulomyxa filosa]|uniref:Uncharacterized protein n=1 Tax=Reticulomyxa filosa TaxID=46433 RepID=X6MHZ4_RETFI|nr:hypothetical protein RFI_23733 [Reticulomyxa filosa]|eukprot:ETO13633.1 hypothetical protein RFI_23733 [Reticulomyxa filosa]
MLYSNYFLWEEEYGCVASRAISIEIMDTVVTKNVKEERCVLKTEIVIQPQSDKKDILDRIFYVHAIQGENLALALPLLENGEHICVSDDKKIAAVRCSNDTIGLELCPKQVNYLNKLHLCFFPLKQNSLSLLCYLMKITIRCEMVNYQSIKHFLLVIYNDKYCANLLEIWKVTFYFV